MTYFIEARDFRDGSGNIVVSVHALPRHKHNTPEVIGYYGNYQDRHAAIAAAHRAARSLLNGEVSICDCAIGG